MNGTARGQTRAGRRARRAMVENAGLAGGGDSSPCTPSQPPRIPADTSLATLFGDRQLPPSLKHSGLPIASVIRRRQRLAIGQFRVRRAAIRSVCDGHQLRFVDLLPRPCRWHFLDGAMFCVGVLLGT